MSNLASTVALRPSEVVPNVTRAMAKNLVPIIRSSPGVGKSDIVRSIARQYNLKVIDMRLAQMDPTDLNGLPHFNEEGFAVYAPFVYFPLEDAKPGFNAELGKDYDGWLIFFDEITSAPKQIQAAAYKIILDRMIGQHNLHPRVRMCAAGNLETDNAVVHNMSTALKSRLIHLDMTVNKDDWINWAISAKIDPRVIAFIGFKPTLLYKFDPESQEHTYPCPRTWQFVSKLIEDEPKLDFKDLPIMAGAISPGPATEFLEFTRIYQSLPTIASILANPAGVVVPTEPGIKYAISTMLVEHFTTPNAKDLITFLTRLPVECQVICLRMVAVRNPTVIAHPEVAKLFGKLGRAMTT